MMTESDSVMLQYGSDSELFFATDLEVIICIHVYCSLMIFIVLTLKFPTKPDLVLYGGE